MGEIFVDELSRFAARVADRRVTRIAEQAAVPPRVGVRGRPGVGCRTVARALRGAGLTVAADRDAELDCYVLAEAVKPEDVAAVGRPVLVVLNKVDVPGGADPAAVAARIGAPVLPMAALVAAQDRRRDAGVRAVPARLGGLDAVVGRLHAAGAAVRYRRLLAAVAALEVLAVTDRRIAEFLIADTTVAARAATAAELMASAGIGVGPADPLRRAVRWRRYGCAPLSALYRAGAADITRGALRLWSAGAS